MTSKRRTDSASRIRYAALAIGGLAAAGAWWYSRPAPLPSSYHEVDVIISGMH